MHSIEVVWLFPRNCHHAIVGSARNLQWRSLIRLLIGASLRAPELRLNMTMQKQQQTNLDDLAQEMALPEPMIIETNLTEKSAN